jgi:RNA polymerase Rpb2, domain 6
MYLTVGRGGARRQREVARQGAIDVLVAGDDGHEGIGSQGWTQQPTRHRAEYRILCLGYKLSSRHGQKGVVGVMMNAEDLLFRFRNINNSGFGVTEEVQLHTLCHLVCCLEQRFCIG